MGITVAIVSGFVVAVAAPWLHRCARRMTGWILALVPLALTACFAGYIQQVAGGQTIRASYAWAPALGVQFSFYLDGLSLLFTLLISGIGALVFVYAGGYLAGHRHLGRFYAFLLMFMASMLGLVLADNVLTLYLFWELTSVASYLLIGFDHQCEEARRAAWQALLVTSGGGLFMLVGLLMLGQVGGTMDLSGLVSHGDSIQSSPLYLPILLLILVGAFTKSAQFPFHFWLPAAMEAPTPVSAYLHSATMVKAGVYLLARLNPVIGGSEAWWYSVVLGGAITMLSGGYLALGSTDLKRVLAYSTISALGALVMLPGIGTPHAIQAAMVFLLAHALYKGALFLVAGAVDHETGTRDADRLGGLWRAMPITATAAVLAALSLAGIAPLFGFIGKEMLLEAALDTDRGWLLVPVIVLAGAAFAAVACIVSFRVFFRGFHPTPKHPHEAPPSLWLGPLLMAAIGLALGLFPAWAAQWGLSPAVLATTVGLTAYALTVSGEHSWRIVGPGVRFYEAALAGLLLVAALVAVRSQTRLAAIAALGVVGYSAALIFILFGAPDLAMTQFAIETLTVILFVFVLYRLPRFAVFSSRWSRIRDAVIALVTGTIVTVLVLMVIDGPAHESVSRYYAQHSVTEAHGRNIVNVILVDFRALDTLGEITVLAGQPWMTGQWISLPLPGIKGFAVGTPLLFDIGVYLVVLGTTLTIILSLAEQ